MTQKHRLSYLLLLNVVMILGLVIVGFYSNSLSVLAAGGDFIADSLAIALGLFAINQRDVHKDEKATTYVALINATMLLVITLFVMVQAILRLMYHSPEISALPVLVVALLSAVTMGVGILILGKGAGNEDLHMRSVFLDTASDGLSAICVAVVGLIILLTHGHYWLDPAAAVLISLVIGYGAVRLLIDVKKSFKSGHPMHINKD